MSPLKQAATAQTAFLGLGSNLGDRAALLAQALARLDGTSGIRVVAVSSLYATAPVGVEDQPEFFNAAAEIRTTLTPRELLAACLRVETELGRVRLARWGPRTIDIDILLFGDLRLSEDAITLPHPRMRERAFVLAPLAEIAPGLAIDGKAAAEWAASVDGSGVRRMDNLKIGWPRT